MPKQSLNFAYKGQEGQILLIVVLVMVVALTVGLSVATRTINNVRNSTEESNSEQAFSAAEAGLEQALTNNVPVTGTFTNNTTYQTTITPLNGTEFALNNSVPIPKDEGVDVWLSQYSTFSNPRNGNLTVFWGQPSDSCNPSESINTQAALEIILISGSKANPTVSHYALDPCAARRSVNNFNLVSPRQTTINGKTYNYQTSFVIANGLVMRIVPLYASSFIAVTGCDRNGNNCTVLPSQGDIITAVGTSDKTQRKIETLRSYPRLPSELFQFVFLSPK